MNRDGALSECLSGYADTKFMCGSIKSARCVAAVSSTPTRLTLLFYPFLNIRFLWRTPFWGRREHTNRYMPVCASAIPQCCAKQRKEVGVVYIFYSYQTDDILTYTYIVVHSTWIYSTNYRISEKHFNIVKMRIRIFPRYVVPGE